MDYLKELEKVITYRNLADHTHNHYRTYLVPYLEYVSNNLHKEPQQVSYAEIRDFLEFIKSQRNLSDRTVNCIISTIRCFNLYVLHQSWDAFQVPKRKFNTFIPYVPTKQTVFKFIDTLKDLKVKSMVSLLYSAGLRQTEVRHLKCKDILRKELRIHITHTKNRSDRLAILSPNMLPLLEDYWRNYGKPMDWLFPQQNNPNKPIDAFFLTRKIKEHEAELGWEHKLTCHSFRHAFGTHLYENGIDLMTIKECLGHKLLESTTIYVHLASTTLNKVTSPFDLR